MNRASMDRFIDTIEWIAAGFVGIVAGTLRPTPPHPMTATLSPVLTCPTLRTAPKPVITPQPSRAPCQSGNPGGSLTAPWPSTTVYSAKQAVIRPCCNTVPSGRLRREVPSISIPAGLTDPIVGTLGTLEYDHQDGISITGGFVYRGRKIAALVGAYVFADY